MEGWEWIRSGKTWGENKIRSERRPNRIAFERVHATSPCWSRWIVVVAVVVVVVLELEIPTVDWQTRVRRRRPDHAIGPIDRAVDAHSDSAATINCVLPYATVVHRWQ